RKSIAGSATTVSNTSSCSTVRFGCRLGDRSCWSHSVTHLDSGATWWRPDRPVIASGDRGSPVAFGGLVAFTAILLLTPQALVPALKSLRLAFVAAGVAIGAHLVDSTLRRRPVVGSRREIAIALALLSWATMTIPFSLWPGGSFALLTDQYLKAVAFF